MANMLKVCLLCSTFGFSMFAVYSQSLTNIVPPTPIAQQIQRYGDYPVGNFTGVPEINIPLFSIKEGDLELPITLSYHASGIKVSDPSGMYGLGWTLNYGGRVSRTVVGAVDEQTVPQPFAEASQIRAFSDISYLKSIESAHSNRGGLNTEFDVFSYNFSSHIGKFILKNDPNRSPVLFPYKPLKITHQESQSQFSYFDITDEGGVNYRFGISKDGTRGGAESNVDGTTSSWLITDITSPNDNTNVIKYRYEGAYREWSTYRNYIYRLDDSFISGMVGECNGPYSYFDQKVPYRYNSGDNISDSYSYHQYVYPLLTEIFFKSGKITFSYNTTTRRLEKMSIYNNNNELLRSITFIISSISTETSRALLKEIKFYDKNNQFVNEYKFEYNGEGNQPMPAPENTTAIDFWGYFNGKEGYSSLLPKWDNVYVQDVAPLNVSIGAADRKSDEFFMKKYTLEKITYPTGGNTVFCFESNRFWGELPYNAGIGIIPVGGLRIKSISNYLADGILANKKSYSYGGGPTGYGIMEVEPIKDFYMYTQQISYIFGGNGRSFNFRRRIYLSEPLIDLAPHGSPVIYPTVVEYIGDEINNEGVTEYVYDYSPPGVADHLVINTNGYTHTFGDNYTHAIENKHWINPVKGWLSGQLLRKSVYKNGIPVYSLANEYNVQSRDVVRGFNLYRFVDYIYDPYCPITSFQIEYMDENIQLYDQNVYCVFNYGDYYLPSGEKKLVKTTESQDGLVSITRYTYDNSSHIQPTQKMVSTSRGDSIITRLKYPHDFSSQQPYADLVDVKHIWTPVVEQTDYRNSTTSLPIRKTKTEYAYWNGSTNQIYPSSIQTSVNGAAPEMRVQFHAYTISGNPQCVSKTNGPKICYLYSYKGAYPIAKIENADYNLVESLLGGASSVENFRNQVSPSAVQIESFLSPLRYNLRNAIINSYAYQPLVGMISSTDSKGQTNYYIYDDYQRLIQVKDKSQNVVSQYDYHYKP